MSARISLLEITEADLERILDRDGIRKEVLDAGVASFAAWLVRHRLRDNVLEYIRELADTWSWDDKEAFETWNRLN